MDDHIPHPLPPNEIQDRIDPLTPDFGAEQATDGLGALPYAKLGGPGFERLCYEILLTKEYNPRFFGRSGQPDYGVDIVVETGERRSVYQCKNLSDSPSWTAIRDAVEKFAFDWLEKAGLSRPDRYVYCTPHPLDDLELNTKWTHFRDDFLSRTGIEILFWDRNTLDTHLRGLPDVVAGRFSDAHAEHFCGCAPWSKEPWIRIQRNDVRHHSIERFIQRHDRNALYVAEEDAQWFEETLADAPAVAIRGLPGAGKTSLALELGTRPDTPYRRIYYTTLKDPHDFNSLWRSLDLRAHLPSLFVLDDAHLDLEQARRLLERVEQELIRGRGRLVLLLRGRPSEDGETWDDTPQWLLELNEKKAVLDLQFDPARTRAVTEWLRPDLKGLSEGRLRRLHHLTNGDLMLLDETLAGIDSAGDLDRLGLSPLYDVVRHRYFGERRRRLPNLLRLAALTQFDLTPLAAHLDRDGLEREKVGAAELVTELFAPPRYQFLHASLAELVLRALMELENPAEEMEHRVEEASLATVTDYLHGRLSEGETDDTPLDDLQQVLRSDLKLLPATVETRLKARLLEDTTIRRAIEVRWERLRLSFLHRCLVALTTADHPSLDDYSQLAARRFSLLLQERAEPDNSVITKEFNTGLRALRKHAPQLLDQLLGEHGAEQLLLFVERNGSLFELFQLMAQAPAAFRGELLDQLSPERTQALVKKAIVTECSISTLHLPLRELGNIDLAQLSHLERAVGAADFLRLISENGTLIELFKVLVNSTPTFRTELLDGLSPESALFLVEKTIAAERSIGTLDLAMRDLDSELLDHLERAVGAANFLRLISENGTLFELFMVLKQSSPTFRTELLDGLSPERARSLVEKSIAAGRSIGTLNLTMRELGNVDPALLGRLERAVGAANLLRLIGGNGTLFELFKVLEHSTHSFRTELLDGLSPERARSLVEKTIAAGRSIGTLPLAMRELGNADPALLGRLERAVGAANFLRLIDGNGTLFELFKVLENSTPSFRTELLDGLSPERARSLVEKSIAAGRSIGTLDLTMRELGNADPALLGRLERAVGAANFLRLIGGNGTLFELFNILQRSSLTFRTELLDGLSPERTRSLVEKTIAAERSIESLHHSLRQIGRDPHQRELLMARLGVEEWWRLLVARGTLNSLTNLSGALDEQFRAELIERSAALTVEQWGDILSRGRFLNACAFTQEELSGYPAQSRTRFQEALHRTAPTLAQGASWLDLSHSHLPATPASTEQRLLREALQSRIDAVTPEALRGLDFREAVNGFAFAWRERPDLRRALASELWAILPAVEEWPRKRGEITDLRSVLTTLHSPEFSDDDVQRLLDETSHFLNDAVCDKTPTRQLFLLAWSLSYVRHDRFAPGRFEGGLREELVTRLVRQLQKRVSPKGGNDEKLAQLALGGLLALVAPRRCEKLRDILRPLVALERWLLSEALTDSFIPSLFALEGLALSTPVRSIFNVLICRELLAKSAELDHTGPAVEALKERVKRYGGRA
ncbi:hypothetical protein [Endothiovibrio diazotrophicus]